MGPFVITFKRRQNESMVFKVRMKVILESGDSAGLGGTRNLVFW